MHLPVYMWTLDCRARGVNTFWELLNLISQCEGEQLTDLKTIEVINNREAINFKKMVK